MRTLSSVMLFGLLAGPVLFSAGCATTSSTPASAADHVATLSIEGMTCSSCSVTVRTAARHLDGVATVDVDVDAGAAEVRFDSSKVSAEQIAAKITDAGYKTSVATDKGV